MEASYSDEGGRLLRANTFARIGYNVMQSEHTNAMKQTILHAAAWFCPEEITVARNEMHQAPNFKVMQYLGLAFESFSAFTKRFRQKL